MKMSDGVECVRGRLDVMSKNAVSDTESSGSDSPAKKDENVSIDLYFSSGIFNNLIVFTDVTIIKKGGTTNQAISS